MTSCNHPRTTAARFVAIAGLALAGAPALGQTALGDGRALDAGQNTRGRFNDARPSFSQELQFRNAIVTGNAPGGLSFRGDLGYRASGEFTGDLGSDELFSFRRDSLFSGLAGMGIRGTDALQYQFSLTTGARPPQNLMGDLSYARDQQFQFGGAPTGDTGGRTTSHTTLAQDPSYVDPRGLALYRPSPQDADLADALTGSLRSSSAFTSTTTLSPVLITTFEEGLERRPYGLTSSVLTGVTAVPMRGAERDAAGAPVEPNRTGAPRDPSEPMVRTAYQEVVERLRLRAEAQATRTAAPSDAEMQTITERLTALRDGMMGRDMTGQPGQPGQQPGQPGTQPGMPPATQPGTQPGAETPAQPGVQPGGEAGASTPGIPQTPGVTGLPEGVTPQSVRDARAGVGTDRPGFGGPAGQQMANEYDPARYQIDPKTLELIRASETPLPSFVDPNASSRDFYSEHMRTGERLIMAERYFDAEERFARALSVRPGEPTAQVGRAHAQLGAGLTLSAAINLRSLFVSNPEVIGARYAGRLLPSPERIDGLVALLRDRAAEDAAENNGSRVSAAFMLAYLGYQSGRPEVTGEGLDTLVEFGSPEDVRLGVILRQVWLPESAPAGDAEDAGGAADGGGAGDGR